MQSVNERSRSIKVYFDIAIEVDASERRAKLTELGAATDVIEEVLELIDASATRRTSVITRAVRPIGQCLVESVAIEDQTGELLGAWRLECLVGRGGMGRVYKAVRVDGHFQQTAAVKVLGGVATPLALEQLAQERQLLANLSHPNIAKLLDGGATAQGHPYLVMEYIEGLPIDEFLQGSDDVDFALRIFLQIASAISFAHRQLIIHCDIKPSNILMDEGGRAVVLDFGIGGLLGDMGNRRSALVAYSKKWASPEQQRGEALTTATDIYSLGALLLDLLPEPVNPELQAICDMATRARPSDRYLTVEALAADINNYLKKLPVRAIPRSTAYVFKKLLLRRWLWFAIAGAFVAAILALGLQILTQRDRAIAANRIAEKERTNALSLQAIAETERTAALIAKREADEERANAQRQRDAAQLAEATARRSERAAKESEAQAIAAANLAQAQNQYVSNLFLGVGKPGFDRNKVTAMDMLEDASDRLLAKASDDLPTFARVQLAYTVGSAYLAIGQNAKAERLYLLGIELCSSPDVTPAQRKAMRGTIAIDLAKINYNAQKFEVAAQYARMAQSNLPPLSEAMKTGSFDSDLIPRAFLTLIAATPKNWRAASSQMGAIEASLRKAGKRRQTADALYAVLRYGGVLHFAVGQFDAAMAYERRAIEQAKLIEAMEVSNRPEARRPGIEWAWLGLGQSQLGARQFQEAIKSLRTALLEAGEGQAAGSFGAIANNAIARALAESGQIDEALVTAQQALAQARASFGETSTRTAVAWTTLAIAQSKSKQYTSADDSFARGVQIAQASNAEGWIAAIGQTRWAESKLARGETASAKQLLDAARPALEDRYPSEHVEAKLHTALVSALTSRP